jgi:hypothetical protein
MTRKKKKEERTNKRRIWARECGESNGFGETVMGIEICEECDVGEKAIVRKTQAVSD